MSFPTQFDPRQADAKYKSFPSFSDWSNGSIDIVRWNRYSSLIGEPGNYSDDLLRRAREVVKRAAAMDTGAIEGLYQVDRGFTFTVATEATLWEAALNQKGPEVKAFFESQLNAYDYVLDLATQSVPIAEAWIRTLHEQICSAQDTYTAVTEVGLQELPLHRGEYKQLPNHVLGRDGKAHSYAPVDLTPAEMHRLTQELNADTYMQAHPVIQASYAHYAFICIHPFADGNGRVARALASVFTYRAQSIPLLILAENRDEYISSLQRADGGDYQPFIDFIMERTLDGIRLADESLRTAQLPLAQDSLSKMHRLFVTKGGYKHEEVDKAGVDLIAAIKQEFQQQISNLTLPPSVRLQVQNAHGGSNKNPTYRSPLSGPVGLSVTASSSPPAAASSNRTYGLLVPKDCGREDDLVLINNEGESQFEVRMAELLPVRTAAVQMRISIFADRTLRMLLDELEQRATSKMREQGYIQ